MLRVHELVSGYGKKQVLFGCSLRAESGQILAIIGPNGAGKSSVLKAVFGLLRTWGGEVVVDGERITGSTPSENVMRGIGYAPQGERVFGDLSVKENLEIGGHTLSRRIRAARIDQQFAVFPELRGRSAQAAGTLSGGEQQMLSIARALVCNPKLLLLDEPSLGLSPKTSQCVLERIAKLSSKAGVTCVIVEQKVSLVMEIAHTVVALRNGRVVFAGLPELLVRDKSQLGTIFLWK